METQPKPISGQVAIVTGGGRGIGRAIAQSLANAGAKVAVTARTRDQLEETVSLIQQAGGQAIAFALDVTDQHAVDQMVDETIRQLGPIDLLVNNAGVSGDEAPIWELNADDWWQVVEINLRGPFLFSRAVIAGMLARHSGRIINISSNAAVRPFATYSAYSVSKAGLLRLTDCLAEMTKDHNVYTFAFSPGLVHTPMTQDMAMWKDVPESDWTPAEKSGELCVLIATGKADKLSGRYFHVNDDINDLTQRADEIIENDLYALRHRKCGDKS